MNQVERCFERKKALTQKIDPAVPVYGQIVIDADK